VKRNFIIPYAVEDIFYSSLFPRGKSPGIRKPCRELIVYRRNGGKKMKSLQERKAKIPYDQIDERIKKTIKMLNQFPFLITTSCCEGHADTIGYGNWVADGYVTLEVLDEDQFLKMLGEITPAFFEITGHPLKVSKQYTFCDTEDLKSSFSWRISYWFGYETKQEVIDNLRRCQQGLESLVKKYQRRYKIDKASE